VTGESASAARARIAEPIRVEQTVGSEPASPGGAPVTFVSVAEPRLSWRVASAPLGWRQRAAELELRYPDGSTRTATAKGSQQVLAEWPFPPLASRDRATVRVRVSDSGAWSEWSPPSAIEVSLLDLSDWSARWITPSAGATIDDPAPIMGTSFEVDGGLVSARLHVSALGILVAHLNGQRVGADHFVPGWTTYDRLVRFRSYDVTGMLAPGANDLAAMVGNGWYRGRIASLSIHRGEFYGDRLALLAQLELTYADGRMVTVGTNPDWTSGPSRVLANDFYDGQVTDLRRPKWPSCSGPVELSTAVVGRLELATAPPVRELEVLEPVGIDDRGETTLVDFGRNLVGWVRLLVRGEEGEVVTVRHAEVLEDGELSMRPLRSAQATDRYHLAGDGDETLEPELTYHGFRHIEVSGVPADAILEVHAVVLGSALTRTAWFECSDPGLNQLHRNVVNSMVGNFLDVPTDCPQRDERLGWTGDIQVFAPTASTLFDVSRFLDEWLDSLALDQLPDGTVPAVVPRVFTEESALAGWGDAAVIVPWVLYQRYGDVGVLRRQYASMTAWVERVRSLAEDDLLWSGGNQLGDWLDPLAPPDQPSAAQADPDVVATASFFHSTDLLAKIAEVLGLAEDARRYGELAERIRLAFCDSYVTEDGRVRSDCQTVYALALSWEIIGDPGLRARAGRRLAELVESQGFTVATGFLGTPIVLHALTLTGRSDDAYRMLTSRDFPSWLYAVDLGATTIWERWDSLRADGSVNPGEMTSFNHYAFGAVANWMHRTIGGISSLSPAAREVRIAPLPGAGITSGGIRYDSPYGTIETKWTARAGRFALELDVPVGVTATVRLPDGSELTGVEHGHYSYLVEDPGAGAEYTQGSSPTAIRKS
jgi:alpha-L-rhamnosidase